MAALIAAIAALVGIVGVIGSLIFSGYQTRQLSRQVKIQNEMAKSEIIHHGTDRLSGAYRAFIDYPELRKSRRAARVADRARHRPNDRQGRLRLADF
jgi:hypothetical protein